jgi:uncharacterized protein (TIGR00296 family)
MPTARGSALAAPSEGVEAVRLARSAIEAAVGRGPEGARRVAVPHAPLWEEKRGVFVTVLTYPGEDLRGCIGFPLPQLPLGRGLPEAARAAALEDPRFPPLSPGELPRVVVEVSLLTVPEPVPGRTADERLRGVTVGRHGLIVEASGTSGLLLPQVAPEQGWDAEQFLEGTCTKAGLARRAWRDPAVRVLRFEARVYREATPGGEVHRRPA